MDHYDDFQRFKDKTRTQNMTFKDLSAQSFASERGDWAILNQLSPSLPVSEEKASLGTGGSVSHIVPQPVTRNAFAFHEAALVQPAFREQPVAVKVAPVPVVATEKVHAPSPALTSPLPRIPPMPVPAAKPVTQSAVPQATDFSHLFVPKNSVTDGQDEKKGKDRPLRSLLEKIASCR